MKITFRCEKCWEVWTPKLLSTSHDTPYATYRFESDDCPNCEKLSYGGLTKEMVAEAIITVADKWIVGHPRLPIDATCPAAMQRSLAAEEARLVLRLLSEAHNIERPHGHRPEDIRSWLLDLAREP